MVWKKGNKPWNKGRKETRPEVLKKMSDNYVYHASKPNWNRDGKLRLGVHSSEKTKDKISKSVSIVRTGTHHSQETKDKISEAERGKIVPKGADSPRWKGGYDASKARSDLSRIGFDDALPLNKWMPNTERHHITNHYVVYIPQKIHREFYGYKREEHRRLVMEVLEQELPILFNFITMYLWNSTEIPTVIKLSD